MNAARVDRSLTDGLRGADTGRVDIDDKGAGRTRGACPATRGAGRAGATLRSDEMLKRARTTRGAAARLFTGALVCATLLAPAGLAQDDDGTRLVKRMSGPDVIETQGGPLLIEERHATTDEAASLELLRSTLGRVASSALLDRDWTAALEVVDGLRSRAALADAPQDERLAVLVDVAINEVAFLKELGETRRALDATTALRLGTRVPAERFPELQELAERFVEHAAIVALRESLAQSVPSAEPGLRDAVQAAVQQGDWEVLYDLGSRAVPVLVELAMPHGEPRVGDSWRRDPLYALLRLDSSRAVQLMHTYLDAGRLEPHWVLKLLASWGLSQRELWVFREPRSPILREASLHELVTRCVDGPVPALSDMEAYWRDVVGCAWNLAMLDAMPASLAVALGRHLRGQDIVISRLQGLMVHKSRRRTLVPLHQQLIDDPRDVVRAMAAEALADFPHEDALRRRVDDREPRVRLALARSLQQRMVFDPIYKTGYTNQSHGHTTRALDPHIGDREHGILRALTQDVDPEVRLEATRAVLQLDEPLEAALYRRLADDRSSPVRQLLAELVVHEPDVLADVLGELGGDPDPAVRLAVASRRDVGDHGAVLGAVLVELADDPDPAVREEAITGLVTEPGFGVPHEAVMGAVNDPDPRVRVTTVTKADPRVVDIGAVVRDAMADGDKNVRDTAQARMRSALSEGSWQDWEAEFLTTLDGIMPTFGRSGPDGRWKLENLRETPEGARALARWAVRLDQQSVVDTAWNRVSRDVVMAWLELEDETFVAWWQLLADRAVGRLQAFTREVRASGQGFDRMRFVLARDDISLLARGAALHALGPGAAEADLPVLLTSLRMLSRETFVSAELGSHLHEMAHGLSGDLTNRLLVTLLEELPATASLPAAWTALTASYEPGAPHGEQLTREILARWHRGEGLPRPDVDRAVAALGRHAAAAPEGLLVEAVRGPYALAALQAMAQRKDPAFLDVLGRCLTPDWAVPSVSVSTIREHAVAALVALMSDEAVAVLLEGATRCVDAECRGKIMAGVSSIQAFQQAQREWQRRLVEGDGRDGAVLALLGMLDSDDADVRYEAVRGLATLDAVDQLPRLIEVMAGDPSERVRAGAKAALDRLHESNRGAIGELLEGEAVPADG